MKASNVVATTTDIVNGANNDTLRNAYRCRTAKIELRYNNSRWDTCQY